MKQCPRCNQLYSPQDEFCVTDGNALIGAEDRGYEVETVVKGTPIVVDILEQDKSGSNPPPRNQAHLPPASQQPQDDTKNSPRRTYGLLLAGIAIGGILVLATILAMNLLRQNPADEKENSFINKNVPLIINSPKSENTIDTRTNHGGTSIAAKKSKKEMDATKDLEEGTPSVSHQNTKEKLLRNRFNGRVIMMNAIVRSAPSIYAPEIGVVSFDEPIKIGKSAGGNNPWFRITTVSGTTGWMHGNTLEFVR